MPRKLKTPGRRPFALEPRMYSERDVQAADDFGDELVEWLRDKPNKYDIGPDVLGASLLRAAASIVAKYTTANRRFWLGWCRKAWEGQTKGVRTPDWPGWQNMGN